ncbi:hypothetical protein AKO1_004905 [Acrasis kona]|uniref:Uncharacterized protein n=1 Tax=Acrasis kona TaxID=1008807 RepID=A0AAW2Z437_9EUKA
MFSIQFPKFELNIPSLIRNLRKDDDSDRYPAQTPSLPQNFGQRQDIFYTPRIIEEDEADHEEDIIDAESIGITIKDNERILFYQRPAFSYTKNVVVMFIVGFLLFTILLIVPNCVHFAVIE